MVLLNRGVHILYVVLLNRGVHIGSCSIDVSIYGLAQQSCPFIVLLNRDALI